MLPLPSRPRLKAERSLPPAALVLMTVFNQFGIKQISDKQVVYSQFIAEVKQGRVAKVTIDGKDHALKAGDCIRITRQALHRIENTGTTLLIFIEVQRGDYFGEDDIVRVEDDFGRT